MVEILRLQGLKFMLSFLTDAPEPKIIENNFDILIELFKTVFLLEINFEDYKKEHKIVFNIQ